MVYSNEPQQTAYSVPPEENPPHEPSGLRSAIQMGREKERRMIRQHTNLLCAAAILSLVAAGAARLIFTAPLYVADAVRDTSRAALELNYGWGVVIRQVLPVLLGELVLILLSYRMLPEGGRWRGSLGAGLRKSVRLTVFGGFACVGGGLAAALVSYLFAYLFSLFGLNLYAGALDIPTQTGPRLVTTAFVYLISPILQELIFRGIFLNHLRRYGDRFAVIISALLCAFYQLRFDSLLRTFLFGMVLGYVAVRTGDVRTAAAGHVLALIVTRLLGIAVDAADSAALAVACLILMYIVLIAFTIANTGKLRRNGAAPLLARDSRRVRASLSCLCAVLGIITYTLLNFSRIIGSSMWSAG